MMRAPPPWWLQSCLPGAGVPFVAANAIYSHKFAGHDALASASVSTYEIPQLFLVLSAFPETDKTCQMNFSKGNQAK